MRLKPTEVRLVAGLLEAESEDEEGMFSTEELAERILVALHEHRVGVRQYVVVTWDPLEKRLFAWGLYPTRKMAHKDTQTGDLAHSQGTRATVLGLIRRD